MRWLALAPLLGLLAPERAEASGCFVGPYTITIDPPLGCEVVVMSNALSGSTSFEVTARRGQQDYDVTGAITTSVTKLDVAYANYACDGSLIDSSTRAEDYNVYRITLTGVVAGDHLYVNGGDAGFVRAAGTCDEDLSLASPACTGLNSGYPCPPDGDGSGSGSGDGSGDGEGGEGETDDGVGCNSSGTPAGLGALALFAWLFTCSASGIRRARARGVRTVGRP